jgi:hypothetical protein
MACQDKTYSGSFRNLWPPGETPVLSRWRKIGEVLLTEGVMGREKEGEVTMTCTLSKRILLALINLPQGLAVF